MTELGVVWAGAVPMVPSGDRAEGVFAALGVGCGGAGFWDACSFSAAPNAAVMPRIAVAEMPVDRMRAERATWRGRFGTLLSLGSVVVIVVVPLAFVVLAVFIVVVFVLVAFTWRTGRIQVAA